MWRTQFGHLAQNKFGALELGRGQGERWREGRFHGPYLREPMMDRGLGIDTLETGAHWSKIDGPLYVYGFQTLYPQLSAQLTSAAQTEGYRFLDLSSVFDHAGVQAFTDYCHLTPAGNQIIADAIFDSLAASLSSRDGNGAR